MKKELPRGKDHHMNERQTLKINQKISKLWVKWAKLRKTAEQPPIV